MPVSAECPLARSRRRSHAMQNGRATSSVHIKVTAVADRDRLAGVDEVDAVHRQRRRGQAHDADAQERRDDPEPGYASTSVASEPTWSKSVWASQIQQGLDGSITRASAVMSSGPPATVPVSARTGSAPCARRR